MVDFIRSGAEPAETMVRSLVDCECDFINCDHPDFIGGRGAVRAVLQVRRGRGAGGRVGRVDTLRGTAVRVGLQVRGRGNARAGLQYYTRVCRVGRFVLLREWAA